MMRKTMIPLAAAALALSGQSALAAPRPIEMAVRGPDGPLAGTLLLAGPADAPVVLILPGSGPTDRDGNSPADLNAASYRLLAEALAERGVSSARIDKRGVGGSKEAAANPNKVTTDDYAADTAQWVKALRDKSGRDCVWLAGHSEGGLIALTAAADPGVCGLVLIATPGQPLDVLMREQLAANPANAPLLADAGRAIDALKAGRHVDVAAMHPALAQGLFNPAIQDYLIDLFARDPAALIAGVGKPVLIVGGLADLQVTRADAEALAAAQPRAKLLLIEGMAHPLKQVAGDDRAANLATYGDPGLPIDATLADAVAAFILSPRD
ncbi:alpha/beta hydrolase [Sphingopyxis sp. PET50]|uniref:alpha/beta hydrolase n=1 Tax=Sphingopyxis sp. PET50 TaxID=2976533 RepID=UPI0021AF513D|nr:alpha/beta fold hydrolase [Sphingopyxis sp. PET50]